MQKSTSKSGQALTTPTPPNDGGKHAIRPAVATPKGENKTASMPIKTIGDHRMLKREHDAGKRESAQAR